MSMIDESYTARKNVDGYVGLLVGEIRTAVKDLHREKGDTESARRYLFAEGGGLRDTVRQIQALTGTAVSIERVRSRARSGEIPVQEWGDS